MRTEIVFERLPEQDITEDTLVDAIIHHLLTRGCKMGENFGNGTGYVVDGKDDSTIVITTSVYPTAVHISVAG